MAIVHKCCRPTHLRIHGVSELLSLLLSISPMQADAATKQTMVMATT